jgi:hypothetical protein
MPRYATALLYSLKGSSASSNISETASSPTMAVTKLIPPRRMVESNVNLSPPVIPSVPTVAKKRPKTHERNPFSSDPPERPDTTLNPATTSAKISAGPNLSAKFAISGVATIITSTLKSPPPIEHRRNIHRAKAARPCFASAYPSIVVGTDEGSPGIPKRIDVMEPPVSPPQ